MERMGDPTSHLSRFLHILCKMSKQVSKYQMSYGENGGPYFTFVTFFTHFVQNVKAGVKISDVIWREWGTLLHICHVFYTFCAKCQSRCHNIRCHMERMGDPC